MSSNLHVHQIDHALLAHSLTILRDRQTGIAEFRRHASIVSTIMLIEATRELGLEMKTVETPLTFIQGCQLDGRQVVVPVLRAGLAMLNAAHDLLADTPVGFLGLERDEETAIAREYYQKFPDALSAKTILVLDPMLATGGSLEDTVNALKRRGATRMVLICIVAAPEGIERIQKTFPEIDVYTAAIDHHLDDRKYIVPGLGDFGDRYFGT